MTGSGLALQTEGKASFLFLFRAASFAAGFVFCLVSPFAPAMAATCTSPAGLEKFHASIVQVEKGARDHPITILHLGDSHISLDTFTRGLRQRGQETWGNAGRGLMPGIPFRYFAPDGFTISMNGLWKVVSSLPQNTEGIFGVEGFRLEATSADASINLESNTAFTHVTLDFHGGPDTGAVYLRLDGAAPLRLETRQSKPGFLRLHVPAASAHHAYLAPVGTGEVRLLGWSFTNPNGRFRYDSHGIVAATAAITTNWDRAILSAQVRALRPDLIILGYGTNEGFNNSLDPARYGDVFNGLIDHLTEAAPGASLAILGPFDGARKGSGERCGGGEWATPPKLAPLRTLLKDIAASRKAFFWDGAAAMGGRCAADEWARRDPPLMHADRVHLRREGAELLSAHLWDALMAQDVHGECRNETPTLTIPTGND